jgi:hypothetical protein
MLQFPGLPGPISGTFEGSPGDQKKRRTGLPGERSGRWSGNAGRHTNYTLYYRAVRAPFLCSTAVQCPWQSSKVSRSTSVYCIPHLFLHFLSTTELRKAISLFNGRPTEIRDWVTGCPLKRYNSLGFTDTDLVSVICTMMSEIAPLNSTSSSTRSTPADDFAELDARKERLRVCITVRCTLQKVFSMFLGF